MQSLCFVRFSQDPKLAAKKRNEKKKQREWNAAISVGTILIFLVFSPFFWMQEIKTWCWLRDAELKTREKKDLSFWGTSRHIFASLCILLLDKSIFGVRVEQFFPFGRLSIHCIFWKDRVSFQHFPFEAIYVVFSACKYVTRLVHLPVGKFLKKLVIIRAWIL